MLLSATYIRKRTTDGPLHNQSNSLKITRGVQNLTEINFAKRSLTSTDVGEGEGIFKLFI